MMEPSSRGGFDGMVIRQLDENVEKTLTGLAETLAQGEPEKAARAASVEVAEGASKAAQEQQIEAAAEVKKAKETERESLAALKAAKKSCEQVGQEIEKAKFRHYHEEEKLSKFREGPLAAFNELSERRTPEPEPVVLSKEATLIHEPAPIDEPAPIET